MNKLYFYMLVGIPASGKTTASKIIKQMLENDGKEYIYLSSDDLTSFRKKSPTSKRSESGSSSMVMTM